LELRLRFEDVEFKRCPISDCQGFFEGHKCLRCGLQFNPKFANKVTKPRIIVVNPEVYIFDYRIRCSHRAEHYRTITGFTPPEGLNDDWDNLFNAPPDLSDVIKKLHWPKKELQSLADRCGRHVNIQQLLEALRKRRNQMHRSLCCPICGQTGVENPGWKLSVVFVRNPIFIHPLDAQGDIDYGNEGD
jgi:hypothetical protein